MLQTYTAKLVTSDIIAKDTLLIALEKPAGFSYRAGQYVSLTVPALKGEGPREATRSMSLASAPEEEHLLIAMRLGPSAYKQSLVRMQPGDELEFRGPLGTLVAHADARPAVYIAGGIGIAPFRGMMKELQAKGWPYPVTLLYSNKFPEDAAFFAELHGIAGEQCAVITTCSRLTAEEKGAWTGECGRIDEAMIKKYVADLKAPVFYVVGLPEMVTEMHMLLLEMGVDGEAIKTELFTGY